MVLVSKTKALTIFFIIGMLIPLANAAGVEAVHFSKLIEFLPDPPSGWEAGEPSGGTVSTPEGSWSMVTRDYSKGDDEASITIFDSANLQSVPYWGMWNSFYSYESTEGYAKTVNIGGYPAWEAFDKNSGQYTLFIGINQRFGVIVTTNTNRDVLYSFANSIDLKGIGALGGAQPAQPSQTASIPTSTPPQPSQPSQTSQTQTPEPTAEKKSPGFEVIAAILGVSMALVLRKKM